MKRLIGGLVIVLTVLMIGLVLVIYAQGKRLDSHGKLTGSGILQIATTPNGANVFVNDQNKGQSDLNIENVKPGTYTIKIQKEHFQTWTKKVEVKEALVTPLKVSLFPSNPSLTALTFDGLVSPQLSPDNKKVVYGVQTESKKGLWVGNLTDRQLFFDNSAPRKIVADTKDLAFSNAALSWSPDSSQVLATITIGNVNRNFLLNASQLNSNPQEVTLQIEAINSSWQKQNADKLTSTLKRFPMAAQNLTVGAKSVTFSKDQSAMLIVKGDGTAVVYDSKPSPVPGSLPQIYNLPAGDNYFWFQGATKNIVIVSKNVISLVDTDGSNADSLFTGDFDPKAVFSWPDGSRLVIFINLNSKFNPLPNLYSLDLT